ncbi:hypothetical protein ACU635_14130 [[Actinomadura] parvosata]|uniref:hypothetical protein n=1 Tax=[Actinomadura] parvosata TaxID=1955412 RepID=UPI00406BFADD
MNSKPMLAVNSDGSADLTVIDYDASSGPYWYVVVDDTPVCPDRPLPLPYALHEFQRHAKEAIDTDSGEVVELAQCTAEDLEWAGISVGSGGDGE